jgi:hypothetical protein
MLLLCRCCCCLASAHVLAFVQRVWPLAKVLFRCVAVWLGPSPPPPHLRSLDGGTPLHIAAANGFRHIVQYLLTLGCDVDARQGADGTAMEVAYRHRHFDCALAISEEVRACDRVWVMKGLGSALQCVRARVCAQGVCMRLCATSPECVHAVPPHWVSPQRQARLLWSQRQHWVRLCVMAGRAATAAQDDGADHPPAAKRLAVPAACPNLLQQLAAVAQDPRCSAPPSAASPWALRSEVAARVALFLGTPLWEDPQPPPAHCTPGALRQAVAAASRRLAGHPPPARSVGLERPHDSDEETLDYVY